MQNKIVFVALCLISLLPACRQAGAAETVPGNACSAANRWQWAGGPENSGVLNGMFCSGSTWTGVINLQSTGRVGIGTTSPGARLDVETGAGDGAYGITSAVGGTGVYGSATATTGANYGVEGDAAGTSGYGVFGYASSVTGTTYGVYGESDSSGAGASGVYGYANATTGSTNGVLGESASTSGWGVYGDATATSGSTYGVRGEAASTAGIGVSGYAYATTGYAYGVSGWSDSTDGRGVYARATASTGTTYGVYGLSDSTSGMGVYGQATKTTGTNYGVYGQSASSAGYGVYCNAAWASGCGGNRAWTNTSDARLKDHIEDLGAASGLDAIMRLRPVRYRWKDAAAAQSPELGFLAQDVRKVLPELVGVGADQEITTPDGKRQVIDHALTMSYGQMVVPLVKAVQELKAENDDLRARIGKLEAGR